MIENNYHLSPTPFITMLSLMTLQGAGVFEKMTSTFSETAHLPMMQNNSDHGIDLMAQYTAGKWLGFEVKTSLNGSHLALQGDQRKGAHQFIDSRLDKNARQKPFWKDPFSAMLGSDSRSQVAKAIQTSMRGKTYDGYVVSFTNWGKSNMNLQVRDWK